MVSDQNCWLATELVCMQYDLISIDWQLVLLSDQIHMRAVIYYFIFNDGWSMWKTCAVVILSVLDVVSCRYVHSECDEGVEQSKLKPEEYVCLACKNRDTLPVR